MYDISQVPIRLDNSKFTSGMSIGAFILIGIVIAFCVGMDLLIFTTHDKSMSAVTVTLGMIAPWAFFGVLILFGSLSSDQAPGLRSEKASTLVIDESGIHITRGDQKIDYLWVDIHKIQIVDAHVPGQRGYYQAVQVRRKGQLNIRSYDDLIDSTFGISLVEMNNLLNQGLARWGVASSSP